MTEEERKHYLGMLVELDLYSQIKAAINESNSEDKEETAKNMINKFYEEYKDKIKINGIEEVMEELNRVDKDTKEVEEKSQDER